MTAPIVLMPKQLDAIAALIKEKVALQAECRRLRAERDALKMFADGVAEGDCHYGDSCPTFGSRHGKCVVCQAREAVAACVPPASEGEKP